MRPASLGLGAIGVAVAIGGALLAARDLTRTPPVDQSAAERLAAAIDGRARERLAAATARARTLAELPVLARAVATDAATVADLTGAEVGFRLQPDERLELGQVDRATGQVSSLLRLPPAATVTPGLDQVGARVVIQDGELLAIEVIGVVPDERADRVRGTIAVSNTIALTGLADLADLAGGPARLEAGAGAGATSIALRDGTLDGPVAAIALASAPGITLRAPAVAPVRATSTLVRGPGLAALGLILIAAAVAVGRARRHGAARPRDGAYPAEPPARGAGATRPRDGAYPAEAPARGAGATRPGDDADPAPAPARGAGATRPGDDADPAQAPARVPLTPSSIDEIAAQLAPMPTTTLRTAPAPGADGPRFGRYQAVRRLGSGGMADVYLARATGEAGFTREVALKVLHPQMARRADAVGYFLDEARLAARLRHPNIVQVLDLGKAGEDYYIAMELIDGPDLDTVMQALRARGRSLPLPIALAILRKLCDGLHVAHTAVDDAGRPLAIIHRDVKTANVLLSRQGEVKVGDFGIARAATSVRTTTVGETRGTAEFMAPEQRMGQPIDIRADVYAVAAVAYELVTSQPINLDLARLAHKGIAGWPHLPPPSALRPDLPRELDEIILGALAFEPEHRPASCAALEARLAGLVAGHGLDVPDKEMATWLAAMMPATAASDPRAGQASHAG